MKIKQPEPFLFEAGERAVLLLHGFTGHSADVRMLGRYLEDKGYTSYAPIYRGHGVSPEKLMETNPSMWWEDVKKAYQHLVDLGYEEIALAGLSMGGMMALKLASEAKVKAVISMCVPMIFDDKNNLKQSFEQFVRQYKKFEQKDEWTIDEETEAIMKASPQLFEQIKQFNLSVKDVIDLIYAPTFVIQARQDEVINPESANYIFDNVETDDKEIKWYENSTHVITLGAEREQLHEDIYRFLETLDWER